MKFFDSSYLDNCNYKNERIYMKKTIYRKIAAVVAIVFSLLTIVEGSQVLFGITQHEYVVFTPLLIYNILMGVVGVITGVALWLNHKKVLMLINIVAGAHVLVLLTVGVIYFTSNAVAMHSIQAMSIRAVIWLAIALVAWKTSKSNASKANK